MSTQIETRIAGAASRPLSKLQIRELVLLARQAYALLFPPPEKPFDAWRHEQCLLRVERGGLTECSNSDYLPLKEHFLRLLGHVQEADACHLRAQVEPGEWARAKLRQECEAAADVLPHAWDYAAGFLRRRRAASIEDAPAKLIWQAIYIVRRRAEQLRRRFRI